jgi:ATP-dependent Lhr-like helicase
LTHIQLPWLRLFRKKELDATTVILSAVDPMNLVGIILPGARVSATSGKTVTF